MEAATTSCSPHSSVCSARQQTLALVYLLCFVAFCNSRLPVNAALEWIEGIVIISACVCVCVCVDFARTLHAYASMHSCLCVCVCLRDLLLSHPSVELSKDDGSICSLSLYGCPPTTGWLPFNWSQLLLVYLLFYCLSRPAEVLTAAIQPKRAGTSNYSQT